LRIRFQTHQTQLSSYEIHHAQYSQANSVEWHRKRFSEYKALKLFDNPEFKITELLTSHPDVRSVAVDIGCGAGWQSAHLGKYFKRVIGIEPSSAALDIARSIYPRSDYPNIEWVQGFAEEQLGSLKFEEPVLFVSGTVLSHLTDDSVAKICAILNKIAPVGSILSFAEIWGSESHEFMWHTRTKDWWQKNLLSWELNFHGPNIQVILGRHKGFHGVKVK
jgi:SAM-dependent methyltransferase